MRLRFVVCSSVLAVLASSLAVLPSVGAAGATVLPVSTHSERRVVTGWIPWWNLDQGLASVESHSKLFSDAAIFWYRATAAGHVLPADSDTPAESELVTAVQRLHAVGVGALPTINDFGMDSVSMGRLLSDPERRKNLIHNLVDMVTRVGADGLDLDFEAMNSPASPWRATVRKKFPVFVAGLRQALHKQGLVLSLTVAARVSDNDPNWTVYDYRALANLPDRVTVLTYDYHYAGGRPGPLAPVDWVNQVARYAHARFGRTPVFMGQPASGLNWYIKRESGRCPKLDPPITATAVPTVAQSKTLAKSWGATIRWDAQSGESHFRYHRTYKESGKRCVALREVWFEDARSVKAKLNVVRKQHVRGIALWSLGVEDPHIWPMLTKFASSRTHRRPSAPQLSELVRFAVRGT